jgi:hypothetical protein
MSSPKHLYKYQPVTIQTLSNLKNRQIWFSKPSRFNDPYDCAIRIDRTEVTDNDYWGLYRLTYSHFGNPAPLDSKYLIDGQLTEQFKTEVRRGMRNSFDEHVETMLNKRGVCCFSEKVDDPLMWSHYADGHRGFCLEFDTRFEPFHKAFKVTYSKEIPSINPTHVLLESDTDPLMPMITTKADCWAYEQEWRIFHREADKAYTCPVESLTGIYLGASISFTHIEIIALVLRDSPTKLYRVSRSDSEFRLQMEEVQYTPFDYRNRMDR